MSQAPSPPPRTYGPKSFLVMAAVCVAFGCAYYFLVRQVLHQSKVTDTMRSETQEVRTELEGYRQNTAQLPLAQEELRKKIAEIEAAHLAMTDQLRVLRLTATGEQIEHDRRVARVAELRRMGVDTRRTLQTLKDELAAWNTELTSLMTNDLGKQLGAEPARAAILVNMLDTRPLSDALLPSWDEQLEIRLRSIPPEQSSADAEVLVSDDAVAEIRQLQTSVQTALQDVQQQRSQLNDLLAAARQSQPSAAAPELRQALDAYRQQLTAERDAQVLAEVQRVEQEYTLKLAAEAAETKRRLGEAELAKELKLRELSEELLRSNTEIEAKKINDAVAEVRRQEIERQTRLQSQIAREQLEAKFEAALPEIKKILVPFITPGHKQLDGSRWIYSDEAKPLSLTGLLATHALDNNQEGYQRVYHIGGGQQNDRPDGPFRSYIGGALSDAEVPLARKVQILLRDFGDILVEKGMLSR